MKLNKRKIIFGVLSIPICMFFIFLAIITLSSGGLSGIFDYESCPLKWREEFDFNLTYKVYDELYEYKGTMVCYFDGFRIGGGSKQREWSKLYKNSLGDIVEKNILYELDNHKLVLSLYKPGYFMSDPNEINYDEELYYITVIENDTGYSLYGSKEQDEILNQCGFQIISWECDPPTENKYW